LWPWQKTEAGEHATHTHRGQLSADAATHAHDPDERAHGDRVEMSSPSWARGNPLCLIDLCCPAGRLAYQHVHESLHRPRSNEHLNDLPCRRAPRALSPSRRCWCCFLFGSRRSQGCEMMKWLGWQSGGGGGTSMWAQPAAPRAGHVSMLWRDRSLSLCCVGTR
jgi:hypothetical protein